MKSSRWVPCMATFALLIAILAGCSGQQDLMVTTRLDKDSYAAYEPAVLSVRAGQQVRLTFKNAENAENSYNFVLVQGGEDVMRDVGFAVSDAVSQVGSASDYLPIAKAERAKVLVYTKVLAPGMSETLTFTAPPAGSYQFMCTTSNGARSFWTYGMVGTLTVEP